MKTKKVYSANPSAPFKQKEAQDIGEFIDRCPDKTSPGILAEIKKNPDHVIHKYIEWDTKKAARGYQLQCVRNIVNHIEIKILKVGDRKPKKLKLAISAFRSVQEGGKRSYVAIGKGLSDETLHKQIIGQAKASLINWVTRFEVYTELSPYTRKVKEVLESLNKDLK